jgi:hypothetical protein
MVLSVAALTLLLLCVAWCLLTLDRIAAGCLVIAAALWLPANNRHLEGHTLLVLSQAHGVTVADVIGLAGWLLGSAVLVAAELPDRYRTRGSGRRAGLTVGACVAVVAVGALLAVATG